MALSSAFSVTRDKGCEESWGQADEPEAEREEDAACILIGNRGVFGEEETELLA